MPQFRYRALNSQGHELDGLLTAANANDAVTQLSRQGLRLKSIEESVIESHVPPPSASAPRAYTPAIDPKAQQRVSTPARPPQASGPRYGVKSSPRSTYNERQFFFAQLGGLLRSGISPADALHTILSRSSSGKFSRQVDDMAKMCAEGLSLSEAMSHYPGMFTRGQVGAVAAGEAGGYLPDACETVSKQQKQTRTIFLYFIGVMIVFPMFVFGILFAVAIAQGLNKGIDAVRDGNDSPAVQTGIMDSVNHVGGPVFVALLVAGLLVYFCGRAVSVRPLRHRFGLFMWPYRWRAYNENLSHFSYHLGQLSRAGLSPFASWRMAAEAVPNEAYADKILKVADNIDERTRLSELMYRSNVFPHETAQLTETGEMTGNISGAMEQVMDIGRQKEKLAVAYIGAKAGCWALLLFTVGGMLMFAIVYLTYIRGVFRVLD